MIWSKLIYHDFSVRFSLACLTELRSTWYGLKDLGPLHELHIKVNLSVTVKMWWRHKWYNRRGSASVAVAEAPWTLPFDVRVLGWIKCKFVLLFWVLDVSSKLPKVCFPAIYKYYIWNKLTLSFIVAAWGASMMIVEIDKATFPSITFITYGKSWKISKARKKNRENVLASNEILQANFLLIVKRFHCWKCSIALFMIASIDVRVIW